MLKIGDKIPDILGYDENGKVVKATDYRGKKLVIYFYPKDNTPGCTAQACNIRDNYDVLKTMNVEVIGVSVDDEKSHVKFISKYNLPFRLIADNNKTLVNLFGVYGKKKVMGRESIGTIRTTFIVSEDGIILKIINKVDTKNHVEQIINELKNL